MQIIVINGPNLNLVGSREEEIYGSMSFAEFMPKLSESFPDVDLAYFQSNVEGELIDALHQANEEFDAIVVNLGAYSHTSVALADAIAGIDRPVVEVHISNIYAREEYRHVSLTGKHCAGVITGFGLAGYWMALDYLELAFARDEES